ncbi:hypothetical protein LTR95_006905 [Oleoguttula sp. CCFEE 5521]
MYTSTMTDSKLIDGLIGLKMEGDDSDDSVNESVNGGGKEVQLGSVDRDTEMMEMMRSMKMTMETLVRRIDKLEVEMKVVKVASHKSKTRDSFAMPNPDAFRHTASPRFTSKDSEVSVSRDDDTESFTNVSRARSEAGNLVSERKTSTYMDKFMGPGVFLSSGGTKSRSALASRGYDNKLQVWGVGFASLMYSCIKKYMLHTGETAHVIDGIVLMKTYAKIVDVLYARIKSADLPAVQADSSNFMATSFSRKDSNSLPESTAKDWFELSGHPDGAECMSVIESIFMAAKMVPEAMVHPISQLTPSIMTPVVRKTPKGPSFSIVSNAKVSVTPNGHENFCRYLKMNALKTYVRYRLDGKTENESATLMMQSMKDTEMFDGKNLHRGRELVHGTSGF